MSLVILNSIIQWVYRRFKRKIFNQITADLLKEISFSSLLETLYFCKFYKNRCHNYRLLFHEWLTILQQLTKIRNILIVNNSKEEFEKSFISQFLCNDIFLSIFRRYYTRLSHLDSCPSYIPIAKCTFKLYLLSLLIEMKALGSSRDQRETYYHCEYIIHGSSKVDTK